MKNYLKTLLAAVLFALLLISCGKDSVSYSRLLYEATSEPSVNMSVMMRFPNKEAMYGTAGAMVRQDCGYVPEGYEAELKAEVIKTSGPIQQDAQVTVRIYLDGVCAAQNSGQNSATISLTVPPTETKK